MKTKKCSKQVRGNVVKKFSYKTTSQETSHSALVSQLKTGLHCVRKNVPLRYYCCNDEL